MPENRPFVLSIAGFDPSGGAGILADCKTFEQLQVYGLAINTANTIQTENNFHEIEWTSLEFTIRSVEKLFETYKIKAVKIGIVPSLFYLGTIVTLIRQIAPATKIVWDTVVKSSTTFDFLEIKNYESLKIILSEIDLITPNYNEIIKLSQEEIDPESIAEMLSEYCTVLLKGGHNPNELGVDYLYTKDRFYRLEPRHTDVDEKHGSGCVLSSAITANLAKGETELNACKNAKIYIENYLLSNHTKLGYHNV
ncbi:hydroxymethylpyrimidine/phosphomethylpyrimidine kinase [Flavobacterium sp. 28A]|uniref:hydroxymethylpyrimidine/phosphomethylpyrimidine kinase n=1 Tax=Flavobacterium sp. 28A TaxID=2735895 RepID=UPI001570CBEC|nr:hydroxymethylpyrimidine/phosphomethylpyrimidine kinase [Flavobacterium sp. 28A]NRT14037.1 hydroxymethylpyrimidine/phosphomethylpyrimidine kinase [Flavobacterium sp. 28A]